MKFFTRFSATMCSLFALSLVSLTAGNGEPTRRYFPSDNANVHPNLKNLPVEYRDLRSPRIQSAASYRVVDSLFNAYSFYGSEQQPCVWDPQTKIFAVIKRGALPPIAANASNPDNSNSLRLLTSLDLGKTWKTPFSLYSGDAAKGGLPRYPCVDIAIQEGATNADDAVFCFFAPLTKTTSGSSTKQRSWDGTTIGYQANDLSSTSAFNDMNNELDINNQKFWWGTDCTPISFRNKNDDQLIALFGVDMIPSDSANTSPALVNTEAQWRKDFYSADKPVLSVPAAWASNKFLSVNFASSVTRTHVGTRRDATGNFYNAAFGFFVAAEDSTNRTFGVSKSTDHGTSWGEFNIMPYSVVRAYAQSINCDPDSVFFDWHRSSTNAAAAIRLTNYSFVVYGTDKWSCVTQLYVTSTQPVGSHLVECNYDNGQWSIRKIADVSLFENADFWRQFDDDGKFGASQTGNELQTAVTADGSVLMCKFLEAKVLKFKDENNVDDSLLTTDVAVCIRDIAQSKWSLAKNVTQSDIVDRTTWIPTTLPNSLTDIPLITIQTADKGSTPREQLFDTQMKMATSTEASYDQYKQYVTVTNFTVDALPLWNGLTQVKVSDDVDQTSLIVSPNPAQDRITLSFSAEAGSSVITVLNTLGQTVSVERFEVGSSAQQFYTIPTASLLSGSYVVVVTTPTKTYSQKLEIVH